MKTSDVGGYVTRMRKARFPSRRKAAAVLKVHRKNRWTQLTPEGLRKIELNQRLPGPELLDQLIKVWGLDIEEAETLRFAVHAQRQRRDGYEMPSSIDDVGDDREAAIASCTGVIANEVVEKFFELPLGRQNPPCAMEDIRPIVEKHLRAYFR